MPKQLAITIAGAVSLGAYEAGVLYEVLDALAQHNLTTASAADQIEIDVITGASAGGMTAAIISRKGLFCADEFRGPYDNPLYNTWVTGIDLKDLQQVVDDGSAKGESALHSLFSSNLIEEIARQALLLPPLAGPKKHAALAKAVKLGLALSNLNGVNYGYQMRPDGAFIYTRFVDQMTRSITLDDQSNDQLWDEIRNAAVACGAFPLAFRTKEVKRARSEYLPSPNLQDWTTDPATFTYTDGAVFQNQPLGMAKDLVDEIDPTHTNSDKRYYLFVSPSGLVGSQDLDFDEQEGDYFHFLQRLLRAVISQSEFHDWITAEQVNAQIALLDARASELRDALQQDEFDAATLKESSSSLLKALFSKPIGNKESFTLLDLGTETLDHARSRISIQYSTEMTELGVNTDKAVAFRDTILALEKAANLGQRDYMRIYAMMADRSKLAGAELAAFLGFFDQRYRDHDYDVGRTIARSVLLSAALGATGEIGPIHYDPERHPIRAIDPSLGGLKLSEVAPEKRKEFISGMKNRLNQALRDLLGTWSIAARLGADPILEALLNQLFKDHSPPKAKSAVEGA